MLPLLFPSFCFLFFLFFFFRLFIYFFFLSSPNLTSKLQEKKKRKKKKRNRKRNLLTGLLESPKNIQQCISILYMGYTTGSNNGFVTRYERRIANFVCFFLLFFSFFSLLYTSTAARKNRLFTLISIFTTFVGA